jgi:glycosyltransferase involved in cell wall biosynthesis
MKILMVTNTYEPHVGGVARSVVAFSQQYRQLGHEVLTVCPTFEGAEARDQVVRVPALEHVRNSDFSFPLPIPSGVHRRIDEFSPDVVHSHHPFLLGDTALRVGSERGIPVVFTHHTQYEKYTHYFASENSALARRFINDLDIGYCNLCDAVIAPSQTVADDLRNRNIQTRVEVIPTGVDVDWWAAGSDLSIRRKQGIPHKAFVVGHVGRLAEEKNMTFLAEAVAAFLVKRTDAWFILCGIGPCEEEIQAACIKHGVQDRVRTFAILDRAALRDVYHAMDVFAFASKSETQGIVLAEAMAAGVPVVAIDAPGVRDIVVEKINGRLLPSEDRESFVDALNWVADLDEANRHVMKAELAQTATEYSIDAAAKKALELYDWTAKINGVMDPSELHAWRTRVNRLEQEFKIWGNFAHAISDAVFQSTRNIIFS